MKKKACEEASFLCLSNWNTDSSAQVGIASFGFDYPADVAEDVLLSKIMELNQAPEVHGILVQLPLPEHIHESRVLDAVVPEKDVDGLHPINVAKLAHTK
jgi:methylenetetrahydrofolate dehydrogenase (NADP+)/methenyltetrahydrofolate cyclohydrolase